VLEALPAILRDSGVSRRTQSRWQISRPRPEAAASAGKYSSLYGGSPIPVSLWISNVAFTSPSKHNRLRDPEGKRHLNASGSLIPIGEPLSSGKASCALRGHQACFRRYGSGVNKTFWLGRDGSFSSSQAKLR